MFPSHALSHLVSTASFNDFKDLTTTRSITQKPLYASFSSYPLLIYHLSNSGALERLQLYPEVDADLLLGDTDSNSRAD